MNIVDLQYHFQEGDNEENVEWIYYDKPYYEKKEEDRKTQEYFERILRENVYENPDLERKIIKTKEEKIYFQEDVMKLYYSDGLNNNKLMKGEVIKHVLDIDEKDSSDVLYGFKTNFTGKIQIFIGGQRIYDYEVKKKDNMYLVYPIFIRLLQYHEFCINVICTDIPGKETEITMMGIKIERKKFMGLIKRVSIQEDIYMCGMFGKTINNDILIQDIYKDYPISRRMIVSSETFSTIHLSIYNMKILDFHHKNSTGIRRTIERTKQILHELIMKTWSPERVEDWCLPIDIY